MNILKNFRSLLIGFENFKGINFFFASSILLYIVSYHLTNTTINKEEIGGTQTSFLMEQDCSNHISGTIFHDANYDGIDNDSLGGFQGVKILAFDCSNNLVDSTFTDISGVYQLPNTTPGIDYRIEFVLPNTLNNHTFTSAGTNHNTSIQFAQVGNCLNIGIANPVNYCTDQPLLLTPCYVEGATNGGGSSENGDVLVAYPYHNPTSSGIKKIAINKDIGSTWGIAHDNISQNIYAGALMKRHSGLGLLGLGGIYQINISDINNPSITPWVNLDTLGVNTGTNPRNYSLPSNTTDINLDDAAFSAIGKMGIGDVDLSQDGKTLYAMNLHNNGSLVIIDVATKSLIQEIAIPNPGCGTDQEVRPWAIATKGETVYIGLICSGSVSGTNDLQFFVLELQNNNFVSIFNESLNYSKGFVHPTYANPPTACSDWETWTDDFNDLHQIGINSDGIPRWCRPQPILSDIVFDTDGSMILGFLDRTGHQTGYKKLNLDSTIIGNGYVGGDIIRVHNNNGIFELENGGTTSAGGGCGANGQGPGGGEYYCDENIIPYHDETSLGGLAFNPSDSVVGVTVMDPIGIFSGGSMLMNNRTGKKEVAFELYNSHPSTGTPEPGTYGKAAGLGDLEIICAPPPIEIGNFVWYDQNNNGIQDACETSVSNLTVRLYDENCTLVGLTTTNNNGQYLFNNSNVNTSGLNDTTYTGLAPNTAYYVVFGGENEWTNKKINLNGSTFTVTQNNIGTNDNIDSDAMIGNGCGFQEAPFILVNTENNGTMLHNIDLGLISCTADITVLSINICSYETYSFNEMTINTSGIYLDTFQLLNGCDSIVQLNLNVFEQIPVTTNTFTNCVGDGYSISVGQSIYNEGNTTGIDTLLSSNGCDSIVTTTLNFLPNTQGQITYEGCQGNGYSITVGSSIYNEANPSGVETIVASNGCDSIVTISLNFSPNIQKQITYTGCQGDGYSISVGTSLYNEANLSGIDTLVISTGCDSIVTTTLNFLPNLQGQINYTGCQGDGYAVTVGTSVYNEANPNGSETLVASNGCDSIVNIALNFLPNLQKQVSYTGCQGDGYAVAVGTSVYNEANPNGSETLVASNGCDSVVSISLSFLPNTQQQVSYTGCLGDGYAVTVGTSVYNEANPNGVETLVASNGCDSIVNIALNFLPNLQGQVYYTGCQGDGYAVAVGTSVYNEANPNGVETLVASNGCDSIINIALNFLPNLQGQINYTGCQGDGYAVTVGKSIYNEANPSGIELLVASNGCDSIVTIALNFLPNLQRRISYTGCQGDGYAVTVGKSIYNEANPSGVETLVASNGCDSIVTIALNFLPNLQRRISYTGCQGDGYAVTVGKSKYNEANPSGVETLVASNGCDSIVTISLNFFPNIHKEITYTGCQGDGYTVTVGKSIYNEANPNGVDTLLNSNRCDSIVTTTLVFLPSAQGQVTYTGCQGDGYSTSVGTSIYNEANPSGIDTLVASNGCDSVVTTNLIFTPLEIGNLVWADINGDGIQNAGEQGINGIEVALIKNGVEIATTITAKGGQYYFNSSESGNQSWAKLGDRVLANMDYTLRIKSSAFPYKVKTTIDENNSSADIDNDAEVFEENIDISLTTEGNGCLDHNYDFGIIPTLCLGNLVWEDANNDGLFNNGEQGIPNVSVTLCSVGNDGRKGTEDDLVIDQLLTDVDGKYLFTCLFEGDYFVKVEVEEGTAMHSSTGKGYDGSAPLNYEPAIDPDNDLDNNDDGSQMGRNFVMSEVITLTLAGEPSNDADFSTYTNTSVDFGLFKLLSIGNKVWLDKNNNGLFDSTEKGVNGVEVALFQPGPDGIKATGDDVLLEQTITDFNGSYNFDELHPGQYWVKLIGGIPIGTTSSDGLGMAYDGTGFYESGVDPNLVEVDSDDNGQQMGTMIMSELIDLFVNQEPINDLDQKNHTNTTIDFALFPQHQIRLFDPCNCLGNASSPTAKDGQLSDKIIILSTISGENWTLKSGTGLFSIESPAPPSSPIVIPTGTVLEEDGMENGFFRYVLDLRHVDGVGYSACFTNGTTNLTANNLCHVDASCNRNLVSSPDATPVANLDPCAQNFILGKDGVVRTDTLKCCDNKSTFSDDGTIDGLYSDSTHRTDIYTICSPDQWKILKFNVKDFDVAAGDTLYVYDGLSNSAPLIGKFSGTGVSQTGGWFSGNCDATINPTGCMTFEFKTNGDSVKGRGWTGNFECSERNIALKAPFATANLSCSETVKTFTFKPAPVTADCGVVKDTQHIRIYNALGKLCKEETIGGTQTFTEKFGIGNYLVIYQLKSDTVKADTAVITVQEAALVCNDKVTVPLGPVCSVTLTPDDLLENPCDTILDTAYYYITLEYTDKEGNTQTVSGGGKGGNYPKVSKEMLDACGGDIKASIERRYYEGLVLDICNNGVHSVACEVTVDIVDQSIPLIAAISEVDTFVMCDIDLTEEGLGVIAPVAVDNCSEARVTFESAKILNEGETVCDTTRVEVTWKAVDECENSDLATQLIVFVRPTLNEIVKTGPVTLACGTNEISTKIPGFKVGKLVNGVVIPSDTVDLDTMNYMCGYILQKRSVEIPSVDCIRKTYQYWSIVDWCNPESGVQAIDTTRIEYIDSEAPEFAAESGPNRTLALDHFSCTYDITQLDNQPTATDNCSEPTVRLAKVSRIVDGELSEIDEAKWTALDCDSFQLDWIAEDGCLKQLINDTLEQIVEIKDSTNPAPVCTDKINVSISNHDVTLHYTDIDAGSYDACGIVKYEISRDQVNWGPTVTFTCEDIHKEIQVSLRVTDKKDNQASCWAVVLVEDKIAPVCNSIKDVKVDCDKYHNGELGTSTDQNQDGKFDDDDEWVKMSADQIAFYNAEFGEPDCFDNAACNELLIQQEYQLVEKSCGIFHAKRRYRAIDWNGEGQASNWAEQQIEAEPKAFWSITFPADWVGECDDDIPTDNQLSLSNGACELLGYEVEERTFTTVEDACLKVVRTYTLTNWCVYKEGDDTYEVKRDENQHGIVEHDSTLTSTGLEEVSRLEYVQILKLQDYTAPKIMVEAVDDCINGLECGASKSFAITATDCNEAATQALNYSWTISSNGTQLDDGEGTSFSHDVVPNVTYEVYWKVTDNCGNTATKNESYTFKDCRKPAPYCIHGIAVELMQGTGMVQVWASDVERGSTDNCTPKDGLDFRIWHITEGAQPTTDQEVQDLPKVITLSCAYLDRQDVHLYVIDKEGNWDFCKTYVEVQDNMETCKDIASPDRMAAVSGTILTWKQNPVQEVMVHSTNTNTALADMTKENGAYHFDLAMENEYTIRPEKDIEPLNGVSTFDLVLISKHILGIAPFDNPYQMIAADVNSSGTITAFDMVQIRQLILNINTKFSHSPSWKFVYADYEFTSANPVAENYPQTVEIPDLISDMQMDFVAIKLGDVNGNASTNNLVLAESRTNEVFKIYTAEKVLHKGEVYTIDFKTNQLATIEGFQFTLDVDQLGINKLNKGVLAENNFGLHRIKEGWITASWNKTSLTKKDAKPVSLFSMEFVAKKDGKLSEQLNMLNRPTPIEAYDAEGQLMDIELTFDAPLVNDEFTLFQNRPNPFYNETTIGFYLPGDSEVQLVLRDEIGRVIKSIKGKYQKGYNAIQLNDEKLHNGLIYYQLSSKFGTKEKKMVMLK